MFELREEWVTALDKGAGVEVPEPGVMGSLDNALLAGPALGDGDDGLSIKGEAGRVPNGDEGRLIEDVLGRDACADWRGASELILGKVGSRLMSIFG